MVTITARPAADGLPSLVERCYRPMQPTRPPFNFTKQKPENPGLLPAAGNGNRLRCTAPPPPQNGAPDGTAYPASGSPRRDRLGRAGGITAPAHVRAPP